jgi:hypothetical protein
VLENGVFSPQLRFLHKLEKGVRAIMAEKHPYVQGPGNLVPVILQFRKSFPNSVTADTLKKLGFAPKNESYVLNVIRFLGLIDQEGNKTEAASNAFKLHEDDQFAQQFSELVKVAYHDLFELHGDGSWTLDTSQLISFFRSSDDTSDLVGKLQARTFQILASFSGHGDVPTPKSTTPKKPLATPRNVMQKPEKDNVNVQASSKAQVIEPARETRPFGLTVRIEINLPADGDQETYDRIFKSIRENLLNE